MQLAAGNGWGKSCARQWLGKTGFSLPPTLHSQYSTVLGRQWSLLRYRQRILLNALTVHSARSFHDKTPFITIKHHQHHPRPFASSTAQKYSRKLDSEYFYIHRTRTFPIWHADASPEMNPNNGRTHALNLKLMMPDPQPCASASPSGVRSPVA